MKMKEIKAYFSASGSGSSSCKINIPMEFVKELGITSEYNKLKVKLDKENRQLIIERSYEMVFVYSFYDDRLFEGDYFEGMRLHNGFEVLTLDKALSKFSDGFENWYTSIENGNADSISDLSDIEKKDLLMEYIEGDEIESLMYFESMEVASKWIDESIKETARIDLLIKLGYITFDKSVQDNKGYFHKLYIITKEILFTSDELDDIKRIIEDLDRCENKSNLPINSLLHHSIGYYIKIAKNETINETKKIARYKSIVSKLEQ